MLAKEQLQKKLKLKKKHNKSMELSEKLKLYGSEMWWSATVVEIKMERGRRNPSLSGEGRWWVFFVY